MGKRIGFREKNKIKKRLGVEVFNPQRNPGQEKIYHEEKTIPLRENPQEEYVPQEYYYFGKFGIFTRTSYIGGRYPKTKIKPKTNVKPKEKNDQIFSLVMTMRDGHLTYTVNERYKEGEATGRKASGSNFQKLYNDPWIASSRHVQNELYAIEKTIMDKKDSIEKHLGAEISLILNL